MAWLIRFFCLGLVFSDLFAGAANSFAKVSDVRAKPICRAISTPVVRMTFQSVAFVEDAPRLKTEWLDSIEKLISVLEARPSSLRMIYFTGEDGLEITRARAAYLKDMVHNRLSQSWPCNMPIEIRIVYQK